MAAAKFGDGLKALRSRQREVQRSAIALTGTARIPRRASGDFGYGASTAERLRKICTATTVPSAATMIKSSCGKMPAWPICNTSSPKGEGNLICRKEWILQGFAQSGQAVLRYVGPNGEPPVYPHNPNGSQGDIAGLSDATGRVLGLMPHPERNVLPTHHPRWTRNGLKSEGDGFGIFRNAVEYFA